MENKPKGKTTIMYLPKKLSDALRETAKLLSVATFMEKMPPPITGENEFRPMVSPNGGWWVWHTTDLKWVVNRDPRTDIAAAMEVFKKIRLDGFVCGLMGQDKMCRMHIDKVRIMPDGTFKTLLKIAETAQSEQQAIFAAVVKLIAYLKEQEK